MNRMYTLQEVQYIVLALLHTLPFPYEWDGKHYMFPVRDVCLKQFEANEVEIEIDLDGCVDGMLPMLTMSLELDDKPLKENV